MKQILLSIYTLVLIFGMSVALKAKDTSMRTKTVAQFEGVIWGISLLDTEQAIITLKKGEAYHVDLKVGTKTKIEGLPPVDNRGQGGLLDVAKSPNFEQEKWLYFTYAKPGSQGASTTLARAQLHDKTLRHWEDLMITDSATNTTRHYGSRIAFDGNNHVFFSVGDRGEREQAQEGSNHMGSILRLKMDGTVPTDNPFVSNSTIKNEIWSFGHRNPQGLFYDIKTATLWSNEHGPRGGDEINKILPGANYGWPVVSHGKEYWGPISIGEGQEKPGIENAIKVYVPSIAPSSLIRYQGDLLADLKEGDFLSTALVLRHLNRVRLGSAGDTSEKRYLEDLNERLRSIAQDPTGILYIGTDSGQLLKVTP